MRKLKKVIDYTTIKFLIVGVINTIVGTTAMFLLYNVAHCSYWLSSVGNYVIGSLVSYFLNKHFTFSYNRKSVSNIVKFIVNISLCYLIAYGCAKPIIKWVLADMDKSIQENIAMVLGMCIFVILNYLGQRYFVFIRENY